jgi:hypothetical protein
MHLIIQSSGGCHEETPLNALWYYEMRSKTSCLETSSPNSKSLEFKVVIRTSLSFKYRISYAISELNNSTQGRDKTVTGLIKKSKAFKEKTKIVE